MRNRSASQDRTVKEAPASLAAPPKGWFRRRLIELLKSSNRPLTAVEINHLRREAGDLRSSQRVYDDLEILRAVGSIDRIELLKAYALHESDERIFLVCRGCRGLTVLVNKSIRQAAAKLQETRFASSGRVIVELSGVCPGCIAAKEKPSLQNPHRTRRSRYRARRGRFRAKSV